MGEGSGPCIGVRAEDGVEGAAGGARVQDTAEKVDVDQELAALFAAAEELVQAAPFVKRRRCAAGQRAEQPPADLPKEVHNPFLATQSQAVYTRFVYNERLQPLVCHRKCAWPGQLDSERLRLLEDFVLRLNLSEEHQSRLYHLVHFWELTMPQAPGDDGSGVHLQESFKAPHALRQAIAGDNDRAVIDDGWL